SDGSRHSMIRMNVLVLTPVYPSPASPAEGLFNQQHTRTLFDAGVTPTVVVCKPWLPASIARRWPRYRALAGLPPREQRDGIEVLYARYLHVPGYRLPDLTTAACVRAVVHALDRFARGQRFDLIQAHSAWPTGLAAPDIARTLDCPFTITFHIADDPRLVEGGAGARLYRKMFEQAAALVAVGRPLERLVAELQSRPEPLRKPIRVIPNGIDRAAIDAVHPVPNGRPWGRLVSVANLWPIKGIDLNLHALAELARQGVVWHEDTVVGDGPQRPALETLARQLGLSQRVRFTGRLPHAQALAEIARADIFTLPSWQEAFGVVYLEAMALGRPVVGCRGQGAEDIIRDGVD